MSLRRDITNYYFFISVLVFPVGFPIATFVGIWLLLEPAGFWEKLGCVIFGLLCSVFAFIWGLLAMFLTNEEVDKWSLRR